MKSVRWMLFAALIACQFARADDLQDAAKAASNKSYAEALRLYTKAATTGNAEAQFHVGEMYWYGEGVAADEATANQWFQKAAASGNAHAIAALETMKQRHARRADIDFWYTKYDGADLTKGTLNCRAPNIPAVSSTNAEISRVNTEFAAWRDCYNRFVANLGDAMPVGKRIPSDIEVLMNDAEIDRSRRHMDGVYRRVSAEQAAAAKVTTDQYSAWSTQTQLIVSKANEAAILRKKIDDEALARSRDYQHSDGGVPIGAKGATVGSGR